MTLDEYRNQLVEQLKKLRDEGIAQKLIDEANRDLLNSKINPDDRAKFWTDLSKDVSILNLHASLLIEKQASAALSQVVAAAQAAIAQHQANLAKK